MSQPSPDPQQEAQPQPHSQTQHTEQPHLAAQAHDMPSTSSLELGVIGNCAFSALVDKMGRIVWCCLPRFDGDPVFNALLDPTDNGALWAFQLENFSHSEQWYEPNTAVLRTRLYDTLGQGIEITDLAPLVRPSEGGRCCAQRQSTRAYSASAIPPLEVHRAIKIAGYTATYSASPSHQWLYTPTATGTVPTHGTLRQYAQGSLYEQYGVQADFGYETQGLGVPVWSFNWRGIASAPSDASYPSITVLAPTLIPPVASSVTLSLGSFTTATVRSVKFARNRNVDTARIAMNLAGGHAGFIAGSYFPEWEVEIERPARSDWDPEAVYAAATGFAFDVQFGSTQYNRWKHASAQVQISAPPQPGADGGLATVTVKLRGYASTPSANDAESILFN